MPGIPVIEDTYYPIFATNNLHLEDRIGNSTTVSRLRGINTRIHGALRCISLNLLVQR